MHSINSKIAKEQMQGVELALKNGLSFYDIGYEFLNGGNWDYHKESCTKCYLSYAVVIVKDGSTLRLRLGRFAIDWDVFCSPIDEIEVYRSEIGQYFREVYDRYCAKQRKI